MVQETLFYLSKFNKLQTFEKAHKYTLHIFSFELKRLILTKVERHAVFSKTNI